MTPPCLLTPNRHRSKIILLKIKLKNSQNRDYPLGSLWTDQYKWVSSASLSVNIFRLYSLSPRTNLFRDFSQIILWLLYITLLLICYYFGTFQSTICLHESLRTVFRFQFKVSFLYVKIVYLNTFPENKRNKKYLEI